MTEVHKSRAASIDLDNVWSYIAADNPDAADNFLRRILARYRYSIRTVSLSRLTCSASCQA